MLRIVKRPDVSTYRTRSLPTALLDRMRVIASLTGLSVEEVHTRIVERGLPLVEEEHNIPHI